MWQDPIVSEVRRVRETHAAEFISDLKAIYRALKSEEELGRHEMVSFNPRPATPVTEKKQAVVA